MTGSNELAGRGERSGSGAYRAGVGIAAAAAFLTVWTTIVRDNGQGGAFFMIIMAVAVGWVAAGFRAGGMARAMAGVAVMQAALGTLTATAPIVANVPGESARALVFSTVFALLWLASGAFFRAAARADRAPAA